MLTNANTNPQPDFDLPCLSVRQPWAWLIVNGWKNVENRTWKTSVRGRILIHAAQGMTRAEYQACYLFVAGFAPKLAMQIPRAADLERGGIVGEAVLLDCVDRHASEWFCGPFGFVLAQAQARPFTPCAGAQGFFKATAHIAGTAGTRPQDGRERE